MEASVSVRTWHRRYQFIADESQRIPVARVVCFTFGSYRNVPIFPSFCAKIVQDWALFLKLIIHFVPLVLQSLFPSKRIGHSTKEKFILV